MPSPFFAALALKASAAVDAVMAEGWTLLPRLVIEGEDNPTPDPARWSGPIAGTFVDPQAKPEMPNSYDRRETRRPGIESGHPRILVSPAAEAAMVTAAAVAGALPASIRQGDYLLRAADGVMWRVSTVFPMAGGTLSLGVNILGTVSGS